MANLPAHAHMFHLRRIPPSKHGDQGHNPLSSLILLDTYVKFGRNHELCDVVLTSSFSSSNMISRDHAEITGVKTASGRIEKYHITDHSLNGTYINDRRCKSRTATQINEGDMIKFGHMNGASIKDCQMAPQANAEFAFVVERASATLDYLGFRDGRRYRPIVCRGEVFNCVEGEQRVIDSREPIAAVSKTDTGRPIQPVPPSAHVAPPLSTVPSSHAHAANVSNALNFFPYGSPNLASFAYSYSGLGVPPNLFNPASALAQWNLQQAQAAVSGFRAPNVFGSAASGTTSMPAGIPSSSTPNNFLQRDFLQNNSLVNSLLTPVTVAAVAAAQEAANKMASSAASLQKTQHAAVPPQHYPNTTIQQVKEEPVACSVPPVCLPSSPPPPVVAARPPVASPPMECDSSVPSPPKVPPPATITPTPVKQQSPSPAKIKDDDLRSERSYAESPPPRRAPAPAPWDSTPSPRPRDSPDRESVKEKERPKKTSESGAGTVTKHRKTNEIARLLEDLTETSWANQVKRVSSSSRRPTEEAILEKNALKEKKKKDKEKARKERDEATRKSSQAAAALTSPPTSSASIRRAEAKKRLKQLSDEESVSSDSDDDEVAPSLQKSKQKRKQSFTDSSNESDSAEDSDDSTAKRKKGSKKKVVRRSSVSAKKPKHKATPIVDVRKVEMISAQDEVDANGDPVVTHDPSSYCGLQKQCTTPQDDQVNWICCDDCDTWYHNICILGHDEPPSTKHFYCGCVKKSSTKNDKKLKKKVRKTC